jgi:hypothetical protein
MPQPSKPTKSPSYAVKPYLPSKYIKSEGLTGVASILTNTCPGLSAGSIFSMSVILCEGVNFSSSLSTKAKPFTAFIIF